MYIPKRDLRMNVSVPHLLLALLHLEVLHNLSRLSLRGCIGVTDHGLSRLPTSLKELDLAHCRGKYQKKGHSTSFSVHIWICTYIWMDVDSLF